MKIKTYSLSLLLAVCALATYDARSQEKAMPCAETPSQEMKGMDMDAMNKRGDHVMGFDHTRTTHHFLLTKDGGVIQVEANDGNDSASRDKIRMHLSHIAMMFAEGDFNAPMLIHKQSPPGVSVMKSEKAKIEYAFEEIEKGGRVTIKTKDAEALKAVHDFLRFQVHEHQTGDPVEVNKRALGL